jgi:hypothetical protein
MNTCSVTLLIVTMDSLCEYIILDPNISVVFNSDLANVGVAF